MNFISKRVKNRVNISLSGKKIVHEKELNALNTDQKGFFKSIKNLRCYEHLSGGATIIHVLFHDMSGLCLRLVSNRNGWNLSRLIIVKYSFLIKFIREIISEKLK